MMRSCVRVSRIKRVLNSGGRDRAIRHVVGLSWLWLVIGGGRGGVQKGRAGTFLILDVLKSILVTS